MLPSPPLAMPPDWGSPPFRSRTPPAWKPSRSRRQALLRSSAWRRRPIPACCSTLVAAREDQSRSARERVLCSNLLLTLSVPLGLCAFPSHLPITTTFHSLLSAAAGLIQPIDANCSNGIRMCPADVRSLTVHGNMFLILKLSMSKSMRNLPSFKKSLPRRSSRSLPPPSLITQTLSKPGMS